MKQRISKNRFNALGGLRNPRLFTRATTESPGSKTYRSYWTSDIGEAEQWAGAIHKEDARPKKQHA